MCVDADGALLDEAFGLGSGFGEFGQADEVHDPDRARANGDFGHFGGEIVLLEDPVEFSGGRFGGVGPVVLRYYHFAQVGLGGAWMRF